MRIENGILKDTGGKPVRWVKANACGGDMAPRFIVAHDTAGALRPFSSVEWFASKQCGTSAHFVVERDGTITQMVPTNRRAYHAGVSSWKGVVGLNSCSVGIEIVNPGKLDKAGRADFGAIVATPDEIVKLDSPQHGKGGFWLPYTPEQIESVIAICRAIVEEYPDCNELVTHYEIAPKRKIDVGPQFPLAEVRQRVFDPTPGEVEVIAEKETSGLKTASVAQSAVGLLAGARALWRVIWAPIWAGILWITSKIQAAVDWIGDRIDDVVGTVSTVHKEVETGVAPFKALGTLVKANLTTIIPALAVVLTVIAVAKIISLKLKADKAPPVEVV